MLCFGGVLWGQPVPKADFFPMAVWYGGGKARAPMLEPDPRAKKEVWRRDLRQIRRLGFNTVRCWIDWASGEPAPGKYNFDTLDVLLELAREEGLKVILQVYMDSAPEWVGRKFPDALYEDISGAVMHPESSPGYCRDHPGVERAELAFYSALAERAGKSPAFLGWDLWSEPHVINWATATYLTNPEFCFCKYSVARFRRWLEKKYRSLDALNRAWYRRFGSWDEVQPGRLSTILSYTDYIDWRLYIRDKLGEDLRARYDAVKRVAPDRVATSHAAAPNLFTSPLAWDGSPDDWVMRKQVDYYGTSFYPKHSYAVGRDVAWRGALLDFARSSGYSNGGDGFWIGELQAGFGTVALNVSGTVTPEDLAIWTWSAIARGAKGINYYAWYPMSTGYESGGFGMIHLDGTLTARSRTAGAISRVVDREQKLFLQARPPQAQVAIVYDPLNSLVGGRQRAATTTGPQSEAAGIERDSMLGAYRAWFPLNIPVDFLSINELTAASMKPYRLVYLPYPLMIPEKAAPEFAGYVRDGGALVAEARLGWNSERAQAAEIIPGLGLHDVMGCRESAVQSVPGGRTELVWVDGSFPGLSAGDRLPAGLYEETLDPLRGDARVVARFADGRSAAVASSFGRGKTLALGSYLSVMAQAQPTPALQRFFEALLDWTGVDRPVTITGGELEVRWLESGPDKILFAFNHGAQPVSATLAFKPMPAPFTAHDIVASAPVHSDSQGRISLSLPPQSVRVLRLPSR